ncbi:MAG: hypothetical protein B1H04_00685 [Planctomycetales bacterium 4484_123]|nr:MAG: hypothetical protein B1H04_00685 [Planctomycetales bacterium 4484_123]
MISAVVMLGGCSTALKETVGLATGARGSVTVLEESLAAKEAKPLGAYERFELEALADDMGGQVPPELFSHLPRAFEKALAAKKIPNARAGKTLLIRGKVLHYEDSSVVGKALGPLEFVVARVQFVDKGTGKVLATANCVGRTTTRVNLGVARKAEGLARAIVKWIDERFPQDKRLE